MKNTKIITSSLEWELKSPIGNSKNTIKNILAKARIQAKNIIIDSCRTEISDYKIEKELKKLIIIHKSIKRLILIKKDKKIIEIK